MILAVSNTQQRMTSITVVQSVVRHMKSGLEGGNPTLEILYTSVAELSPLMIER